MYGQYSIQKLLPEFFEAMPTRLEEAGFTDVVLRKPGLQQDEAWKARLKVAMTNAYKAVFLSQVRSDPNFGWCESAAQDLLKKVDEKHRDDRT